MRKSNFLAKFLFFSIISSTLVLMLLACNNSLQDMVDEYNSNFIPTKDKEEPLKPGDKDFDPSLMLFPSYYICTDGSVNLTAPESASYSWKITDIQNTDITATLKFYKDSGPHEREFRFYLPLSYPEIGVGTYKITLEVTDDAGNPYADSAKLVVYENLSY